MANVPKYKRPPEHLSDESRKLWRSVMASFELEPHHRRLLTMACESLDRSAAACAELRAAGSLTVPGRDGVPKPHPLIAIEASAKSQARLLLRELSLDRAAEEPGRGPRLTNRYEGRE
jgi:phage terminase small subunit